MRQWESLGQDLYLVLADCKYVNVILLWRIQTYNSALFSQVKFSVLECWLELEPVSWFSPSQPSTINWSFHPISWSNYETSSIKSKCHKKCKFQAKPTKSKHRDKLKPDNWEEFFLKPPALCRIFLQAISLYLITDNNWPHHNTVRSYNNLNHHLSIVSFESSQSSGQICILEI